MYDAVPDAARFGSWIVCQTLISLLLLDLTDKKKIVIMEEFLTHRLSRRTSSIVTSRSDLYSVFIIIWIRKSSLLLLLLLVINVTDGNRTKFDFPNIRTPVDGGSKARVLFSSRVINHNISVGVTELYYCILKSGQSPLCEFFFLFRFYF